MDNLLSGMYQKYEKCTLKELFFA